MSTLTVYTSFHHPLFIYGMKHLHIERIILLERVCKLISGYYD